MIGSAMQGLSVSVFPPPSGVLIDIRRSDKNEGKEYAFFTFSQVVRKASTERADGSFLQLMYSGT